MLHRDHYEVYKNKKQWENGNRVRDVWSDGRPKGCFDGRAGNTRCDRRSADRSAGLHVRVVPSQDELEDFVLVEGSREALRFLAEIILALAESDTLPAHFSMSPSSAGRFHLADTATEALYINCVDNHSKEAAARDGEQSAG